MSNATDGRATAHRFRALSLLVLAGLLAMGSLWLLDVMRRGDDAAGSAFKRSEPDFYVEQFTFLRLDDSGKTRYRIAGERLTHNPQDDSHDILQPRITNLSENLPPTTARSERARSNSDNSQVQMFDKVEVERPASVAAARFNLKSNYLLILPDEEVMKTDLPVEILSGPNVLNGTGMWVNHATREFRLANRVRGQLAPRPHS